MPINWNLAGYVNPDIKITPDQVPLEAMLNVGDELQKRYDTSLENDTKLGIALRSMLQNANEVDKPAAKEAFDFYTNNLKERAASGKYHKMKYQTIADAGEFAGIYEGLVNRNKEIKDYEQKYVRERKDLSDKDKEELIALHRSKLKGTRFNSENRFIEGLDFDKKLYAGNIETVELLNSLASGWKANSGGGRSEEYTLTDGTQSYKGIGILPKGTLIKKTTDGQWEKVSGEEVNSALNSALDNHIGFNQMVDRKLEQSLFTSPLQQGETPESRRQAIRQDLSKGALDFATEKNAYTSSISKTTTDINLPNKDNDSSGSGSKDDFIVDAAPNLYSKSPKPRTIADRGVYLTDNGVLKVDENAFTKLKQNKALTTNPFGTGFIQEAILKVLEVLTPNDEVDVFDSKILNENPALNNKVEKLKKTDERFNVAYRGKDWKTVNKILLDDVQNDLNKVESAQWHVPNPQSSKSVDAVNTYTDMYVGKNGLGLAQQLKVYDAQGKASSFNDYAKENIAGETLADKAKNVTFSGRYENEDGIYDYGSVKFTVQKPSGEVEEVFIEPLTSAKMEPAYLRSKINKVALTDSPIEFDYVYPPVVAKALGKSKDKIKVMADYSRNDMPGVPDIKIYKNGEWVDDAQTTQVLQQFMSN